MPETTPLRSPSVLTSSIALELRPSGMPLRWPMTAISEPMMAFEFPEFSFLELRRIIRALPLSMLITP